MNLTQAQIDKLIDLDLSRVCLHEAAHCLVAEDLGYGAYWNVTKRDDIDPLADTYYNGRCHMDWEFAGATEEERRLIGLAGEVAVLMEEENDLEEIVAELEDAIDQDLVSATDLEMIGDCTEDDIQVCMFILERIWPALKVFAESGKQKQLKMEVAA